MGSRDRTDGPRSRRSVGVPLSDPMPQERPFVDAVRGHIVPFERLDPEDREDRYSVEMNPSRSGWRDHQMKQRPVGSMNLRDFSPC